MGLIMVNKIGNVKKAPALTPRVYRAGGNLLFRAPSGKVYYAGSSRLLGSVPKLQKAGLFPKSKRTVRSFKTKF